MEHIDEHEMLIEYSEMTSFDFNSKEFQEVRRDVVECKDMLFCVQNFLKDIFSSFKPVRNY